jgi:hypothetical protein
MGERDISGVDVGGGGERGDSCEPGCDGFCELDGIRRELWRGLLLGGGAGGPERRGGERMGIRHVCGGQGRANDGWKRQDRGFGVCQSWERVVGVQRWGECVECGEAGEPGVIGGCKRDGAWKRGRAGGVHWCCAGGADGV